MAYIDESKDDDRRVAIVGLACHLPGGITSPDSLWQILVAGKSIVREYANASWAWPIGVDTNSSEYRGICAGAFFEDLSEFDAAFFQISRREAEQMDPQQRLLLQTINHCIEDAGYDPRELRKTRTGVFVGASGSDYRLLMERSGSGLDPHAVIGTAMSILPNRVSHLYDLRGPSLVIDTACSSSLVALHHAVRSIRTAECDAALVASVNVICHPTNTVAYYAAGMLSPSGSCRSFDSGADGMVRGEGVVSVFLKPMRSAVADGDNIHGVILGSATNHGGRAWSLTAPNIEGQAELLKEAYRDARVDMSTIQYIEAHGSGTCIGDPIEFAALKKALSYSSPSSQWAPGTRILLSSLKPLVGHLEAAAGLVGVAKILLSMKNKTWLGNPGLAEINAKIDLSGSPFEILGANVAWDLDDPRPPRAGVSSFGFGGSNAHVVFESYKKPHRPRDTDATVAREAIVLSAKSPEALFRRAAQLAQFLRAHPDVALDELAHTLQLGRTAMEYRAALIAHSTQEVITALEHYVALPTSGTIMQGCSNESSIAACFAKHVDLSSVVQSWMKDGPVKEALELWVQGVELGWRQIRDQRIVPRISLPIYPYERTTYWWPHATPPLRRPPIPARISSAHHATLLVPIWGHAELAKTKTLEGSRATIMFGGTPVQLDALRCVEPRVVRSRIDPSGEIGDIREELLSSDRYTTIFWFAPHAESVGDSTIPLVDPTVAFLRFFNALSETGYLAAELDLFVITSDGCRVHSRRPPNLSHVGVHGLAATLAKEVPRCRLRILDIEAGQALPIGILHFIPATTRAPIHRWESQRCFVRQLQPIPHPERKEGFRRGGVYIIVGGKGKVGAELDRYLRERYEATVLTISTDPRRALAEPDSNSHFVADAASEHDLERAFHAIAERYPVIDGVIHAALRFSPARLVDLSEDALGQTWQSKVDTTRVLFNVLKRSRTSSVIFLSSMVSFIKNVGQAHYAAACMVQDALAAELASNAQFEVRCLNSGLWAQHDVPPDEIEKLSEAGIHPVDGCTGAELIDEMLSLSKPQIGFINAEDPSVIEAITGPVHLPARMTGIPADVAGTLPSIATIPLMEGAGAKEEEELENVLLEVLAITVNALDKRIASDGGTYSRWLAQSNRLLRDRRTTDTDSARVQEMLRDVLERCDGIPAIAPRVPLLRATTSRLLPILTNDCKATEVMFPNGSSRLVEGVYRDKYSREANARLAEAIRERVSLVGTSNELQMLEVGAGTGATTEFVLNALQTRCVRYLVTDISPSLLRETENRLRGATGPIEYRVFDIEKSADSQGLPSDCFDIVVATNVLHTCRAIRSALRHLRQVLRTGGLLCINEIIKPTVWMHMSFGLLDGWWRFTDDSARISGSPLLSPSSWIQLLRDEGFDTAELSAGDFSRAERLILVAQKKTKSVRYANLTPHRCKMPEAEECQTNAEVNEEALKGIIARYLKAKSSSLSKSAAFSDLGIDSIGAVRIVKMISSELGVSLNTSVLFDRNTIERLARHVTLKKNEANTTPVIDTQNDAHGQRPFETVPTDRPRIQKEPIAIIGMSGRFPKCDDVDQWWSHLVAGDDLTEEVSRWPLEKVTLDDGRKVCSRGGFLQKIEMFDAGFFNISGTEAKFIDPQQRLLLEEAWWALEDAGWAGHKVQGKDVGIYIGCSGEDYSRQAVGLRPAHAMWGKAMALLPARLAYFLDLRGPAMAVDTACSSSLVAVHLACQALWTQDISMALAGGVWVQCDPDFYEQGSRAGMLSARGKCFAFDERADGFVPSEAVGVLVLKALSHATADGDRILGVIKGIGTNQDGFSNGITAPNPIAQQALQIKVHREFGIDPSTIQYVEAHGTGTSLGDPIEYRALSGAFESCLREEHRCAIGSVKANMGHAGAAAGVVGLMKVLMSMKHKTIAPIANFHNINREIDLSNGPFYFNTTAAEWPPNSCGLRRAAVNSFGIGGTNAHAVIDEAPPISTIAPSRSHYPICISARTPELLDTLLAQFCQYCCSHPDERARDVSYTLLVGRRPHSHRLAFIAGSMSELHLLVKQTLDVKLRQNALAPRPIIPSGEGLGADHEVILAAQRYLDGLDVDIDELFADERVHRVAVPRTIFEKQRFWITHDSDGSNDGGPSAGAPSDIKTWLRALLARLLSWPLHKIDSATNLYELGLDSIHAAEIQRTIESAYHVRVPLADIMENPTVDNIVASIHALPRALPERRTSQLDDALEQFRRGTLTLEQMENIAALGAL
jgi:acyl transferase domain-containing protein/SAM-dependent methyltransferase